MIYFAALIAVKPATRLSLAEVKLIKKIIEWGFSITIPVMAIALVAADSPFYAWMVLVPLVVALIFKKAAALFSLGTVKLSEKMIAWGFYTVPPLMGIALFWAGSPFYAWIGFTVFLLAYAFNGTTEPEAIVAH